MPDFLGFIGDAVQGLFGWLADVLPQSPFTGLQLPQGVDTALGWLNWLVPMGGIMALYAAWLAAVLLYRVIRFVAKRLISKTVDKIAT